MSLTLLRGLPGSGKSTLARTLFYDDYLIEADDFFNFADYYQDTPGEGNNRCLNEYIFDGAFLQQAHAMCQARTDLLLKAGKDVIVANTFSTLGHMDWYIGAAHHYKTNLCVIHCCDTFESTHKVPATTIAMMKERWQPYKGEAFHFNNVLGAHKPFDC